LNKPIIQPEFDFLGELKNIFLKIHLFQVINIVQIYAKVLRELCLRNLEEGKKYLNCSIHG